MSMDFVEIVPDFVMLPTISNKASDIMLDQDKKLKSYRLAFW